jgi:four helix bundle protein
MSNFENLKVWHRAVELAVSVYNITEDHKSLKKDFGLKDQMRRSAVSISSNISEGDELGTDKQAVRQFFIAKGSTAELYTQITIAHKIGYLKEDEKDYFSNECKGISGMLSNLIKSRYSE